VTNTLASSMLLALSENVRLGWNRLEVRNKHRSLYRILALPKILHFGNSDY